MPHPTLRSARPEDAEALAAFGRSSFIETFVEGFAIPYPQADLALHLRGLGAEAVLTTLLDPASAVWIVEVAGEVGGYAVAGPNTLPHPHVDDGDRELKRFYLRRDLQGAGVARPLMLAVMAWLDPDDDRASWLGVWSGNARAQRFYARYGFLKVGEYDYRVGASIDREFILRRDRRP